MAERASKQLTMVAVAVFVLVSVTTVFALDAREAQPRAPSERVSIPETTDLQSLHEQGVTGENVSVGVVDVTGFDTTEPAFAEQVVAARSFAPGESVSNGGRHDHGTAVATVVSRIAPDADLHLATFDTVDGYGSAMAWLLRQDVDVIVVPVSFYGQSGDGSARVARIADLAAKEGVVVVAPAGNLGRSHWTGRYDAVRDGYLLFGETRRNYLRGDQSALSLWLSWEGGGEQSSTNYTLELYADEGTESRLVARSQPYPGDGEPNERIVAQLDPRTSYYVVVSGPPNATGDRIDVASPTHRLQFSQRARSVVAPATAESVIAVGAYDNRTGRVEPFSSAGPVDGRPGVDIVAPDRLPVVERPDGFAGSSAAAPYVAGTVALLLDVNPGLERVRVERVLERTARDAGRDGVDHVTGYGRVRPGMAVSAALNATGE